MPRRLGSSVRSCYPAAADDALHFVRTHGARHGSRCSGILWNTSCVMVCGSCAVLVSSRPRTTWVVFDVFHLPSFRQCSIDVQHEECGHGVQCDVFHKGDRTSARGANAMTHTNVCTSAHVRILNAIRMHSTPTTYKIAIRLGVIQSPPSAAGSSSSRTTMGHVHTLTTSVHKHPRCTRSRQRSGTCRTTRRCRYC